jgi:hypothetical protein
MNYTPNHRRISEYLLKKPFPPHPRFSLPELLKIMSYIAIIKTMNYSGLVVK